MLRPPVPFNEEEMDKLYKVYANIRLEQLNSYLTSLSDVHENGVVKHSIGEFYKDEHKKAPSTTRDASQPHLALMDILSQFNEHQVPGHANHQFSRRVLGASSGLGLLSFVLSQLDVLTALSVVSNLEARAQYDPQFRTSFPDFLRRNSWFL